MSLLSKAYVLWQDSGQENRYILSGGDEEKIMRGEGATIFLPVKVVFEQPPE